MKRLILLALAISTALGASAQTTRTLELDLRRAIDIALDENPTIKVAGLEIERQRLVKNETIGSFLPTLSTDGTYTRALKKSGGMAGLMSADNTVSIAGSASLPLLVPALFKTLKLNDEQMRAAVESARASKITLVNEVKKAYYLILLGEESLAVLRSSEAMIERTVDDTRTKFENDLASEYDLVTAEVQLSNLQPTIYQAENGVETSRKLLKAYLNLPDDVEIAVTEKLVEMTPEHAGDYTRDIAENSDLRAVEIQGDVLRRQLGVLRTQRMPSLVAFGAISPTGMEQVDFQTYMTTGKLASTFEWNYPINVGAKLSIPIFAGRTNVMREKQLKNGMRQLDLNRDYLRQNLAVQVDNAISDIETALAKMLAGEKTIGQARKGYDISKVRYDAGMGTILELNSAELAHTQARLNYTQAVYDYLSAQADYEKIIGKE